jgi:hypothetical protein
MPVELGDTARRTPSLSSGQAPAPVPLLPPLPPAARFPAAQPRPLPPPLAMYEYLRYRVDYGVLSIGEIRLSIDPGAGPPDEIVRADGYGEGSILGFGRLANRVSAEFDAQHLSSRRWVSARRDADGTVGIRDVGLQPRPGQVQLTRVRTGARAELQRASLPASTLDPMGFLLRVRAAPPPAGSARQVLHFLDGQALWRVTLVNAGRETLPDSAPGRPVLRALRIEGHADPVRFDGALDPGGDRAPRDFVLWLSDDAARIPLRLEVPFGIGDLVVALVQAERLPRAP